MWLQEDPRTCKFIRSQEQYDLWLRGLDADKALEATGEEGQCFGDGNAEMRMQWFELKQEVEMMKQQLHGAVMDICNLKMQRREMKAFGMDTSVAVALCVGVVIGMLVTAMWKSM
jgi:sensor c-di-GMP phosphodiesterase-like protein